MLVGNPVQRLSRPVTLLDHLCPVCVVFDGGGFNDVLGLHEWHEIAFQEISKGWHWLLLADANQAVGERSPVGRFHVPRLPVVALLRGFAYQFAIPHELVPVDVAAFIDAHSVLPSALLICPLTSLHSADAAEAQLAIH